MNLEKSIVTEETRDSIERKSIEIPIEFIVRKLHKTFPKINADTLTFSGVGLAVIGSIAALENNRKQKTEGKTPSKIVPSVILSIAHILDLLDGSMARLIASEDNTKENFYWGGIYDAVADRIKETAMTMSRISYARHIGGFKGTIGEIAGILSGVTGVLPSIARSICEEKGIKVSETAIGSSATRTILGTLITVFPEIKGFPIQPFVDLFITAGSIKTTKDRLSKLRKKTNPNDLLPESKRQQAKARKKTLIAVAGISLLAISGVTVLNHQIRRDEIIYSKP